MLNSPAVYRAVAERTGLSYRRARLLVNAITGEIGNALAKGETVRLPHFGRFKIHPYPSKSIPDPQGRGHQILVLETKVIKFRPSDSWRKRVEPRKGFLHRYGQPLDINGQALTTPPDNVDELQKGAELLTKPTLETEPESAQPRPDLQSAEQPQPNQAEPPKKSPNLLILFDKIAKQKQQALAAAGNSNNLNNQTPPNSTTLPHALPVPPTATPTPPTTPTPTVAPTTVKPVSATAAPTEPASPSAATDQAPADQTPTVAPVAPKKPVDIKYEQATQANNIAVRDLSEIRVPKEVLNILPELFARRHKAAPIEATANSITVAMVDPENLEIVQLIKKSTGLDVVPVLASTEDISRILNQYSGLEKEVAAVVKDTELDINKQVIAEAEVENVESAGDDSPTSRIVLSLLRRAVREKASDVHIEPQEKFVLVRFRIDGVLAVRIKLPIEIQSAIVSRLKILASLKIDEHRLPQDGRFQLTIDKNSVDFRLSILPVANGEKAVMRVLDKSQGILTLEEIGVRGQAYDVINENIKKSYGMTLVCGPTGSGKTTTQYALLGQLMDVGVNIVTLENPIEYRIEGINQSQVNPDIKYDFADGLRAIVRQDPDIIMVGEIRDKETAEIAIQSALTGHIVLSTLHTNTAAGAFPRLIDMGVEPFLISSSINTVVAQRLARKLCDHCKQPYQPSQQEAILIKSELVKIPNYKAPATFAFFTAKGCDACNNTGYRGRLGVFEVLGFTDNIKELVLASSPDNKIEELAIKNGMVTMMQDGLLKAIDGITSLEEVWRVTKI